MPTDPPIAADLPPTDLPIASLNTQEPTLSLNISDILDGIDTLDTLIPTSASAYSLIAYDIPPVDTPTEASATIQELDKLSPTESDDDFEGMRSMIPSQTPALAQATLWACRQVNLAR